MRRRVYGAEMSAEPSQFLNEMPLDMIEDLTRGSSWLSFAKSSNAKSSKAVASALRGENRIEKPKTTYTGKTYNSADAIAEFFKNKKGAESRESGVESREQLKGIDKLKAISSQNKNPQSAIQNPQSFVPGAHVRHPKYGKGLILRREGSGDNVKLTVSFPGFGQKKLIEKYANLEKA
jgi:DNA helicase II / ATP-dependent DNA helicase PcrA